MFQVRRRWQFTPFKQHISDPLHHEVRTVLAVEFLGQGPLCFHHRISDLVERNAHTVSIST